MIITFFQTILKVMRGLCEKGIKCIFFSWNKCGFIKFDNQGAINNMDWELNQQHKVIITMGTMTFKCNAKSIQRASSKCWLCGPKLKWNLYLAKWNNTFQATLIWYYMHGFALLTIFLIYLNEVYPLVCSQGIQFSHNMSKFT